MERLVGSDAGFLFIESRTQTSTCVDVALLGAGTEGPLTVDELKRHLSARLHLVPSLRWRLEQVPFGLHHPVWIEDPDFDLDLHVRRFTVPPGDPSEQLDQFVVSQLPILLDRRHPLWRVTLVDGLADDSQALVFCFHHAMADGAALITTLDVVFNDVPAGPVPTWVPEKPRPVRLFVRSLFEQLRAWVRLPVMLVRTLRRFRAVEKRRAEASVAAPPAMNGAPGSAFNCPPDEARTYARARLALSDIKSVRLAAGTTTSDVVTAVVAGALRSYLLEHAELPERPLVVNVPVGNDAPGAPPRQHGNRFANYFAYLPTDMADPLERLAQVAANNAEAKEQLEIQGRETLSDWLDHIPPAIAGPAARRLGERTLANPDAPDFNVLVSNVRIPSSTWHLGTRPVEQMFMSGPAADGSGLNITSVGYGPHVHLSVVANPAAVGWPYDLEERMAAELVALVAATAEVAGASAQR